MSFNPITTEAFNLDDAILKNSIQEGIQSQAEFQKMDSKKEYGSAFQTKTGLTVSDSSEVAALPQAERARVVARDRLIEHLDKAIRLLNKSEVGSGVVSKRGKGEEGKKASPRLEVEESKKGLLKVSDETKSKIETRLQDKDISGKERAGLVKAREAIEVSVKGLKKALEGTRASTTLTPENKAEGSEIPEGQRLANHGVAGHDVATSRGTAVFAADVEKAEQRLSQELRQVAEALSVETGTTQDVSTLHSKLKTQLKAQLSSLARSRGTSAAKSEAPRKGVVAEKETAEGDSPEGAKTSESNKASTGETSSKTGPGISEIQQKIDLLTTAIKSLDVLGDKIAHVQVLQQAVIELGKGKQAEEFKRKLEEILTAEEVGKEEKVVGGSLIQASSVGAKEEKNSSDSGKPDDPISPFMQASSDPAAPAEGASFSEAPLVAAASGESAGGESDFTGTGLMVAASNPKLDSQMKKMEDLIQKMILALQAGNTSVITDILLLLGLKEKKSLIAAATVVIKAFEQAEKQTDALTKDLEAEALGKSGTQNTAKIAFLNNELAKVGMFKNTAMGMLREVKTAEDAVEEFTSSWLNVVGQQARQMARWQN